MPIELLWIFPILAVAVFVLIQLLAYQKRRFGSGLEAQVANYNSGREQANGPRSDSRLHEMENTIRLVTAALTNQQKLMENYQGKDSHLEKEFAALRKKLSEVQHEYDMILSENYSLKAKLKRGSKASSNTGSAPSAAELALHDTKTYTSEEIAAQLSDTKDLTDEMDGK